MPTRRQTILALTALAGGTGAYTVGASYQAASRYNEAVLNTWRHTTENPVADFLAVNRELVRYATLAASSHNTQCWKFGLEKRVISILPDWTRRCPAVDPDDHHLFVSLGCATENLIQAATAFGKYGEVHLDAALDGIVKVILEPSKVVPSVLFDAIPQRQCTRAEYDGEKLSNDDLETLELAGSGQGVRVLLITEKEKIENILEYVIQGNTMQMKDRAFVEELEYWIRFSNDEVVNRGDGLFAGSSGNPVIPRWLGMRLLNLFFTAKSENDKYAKHCDFTDNLAHL